MNTQKIAIVAALGIGAYLLLTRTNRTTTTGQPVLRPTVGGMNPAPGFTTAPRQQLDQLNNNALYGIGSFLGGIFGGGSSTNTSGGNRLPASGGVTEIRNDDLPGQPGYGWRYYSDGTTIGPDGSYYSGGNLVYTPDSVAVNPPGGYEQPYTVDYTNDELIYWN